MKSSQLHIFNSEMPAEAFQIEYQFDGSEYSIVDAELEVSSSVTLKVTSRVVSENHNFSVTVTSNGKLAVAVMGVIRNMEAPEPCILFRAENDLVYQIGIDI